MMVRSLASLSGLRIQHCHDLWCRSQTQLESCMAVVQAGSCSSDLTPSLGTGNFHMLQHDPKKKHPLGETGRSSRKSCKRSKENEETPVDGCEYVFSWAHCSFIDLTVNRGEKKKFPLSSKVSRGHQGAGVSLACLRTKTPSLQLLEVSRICPLGEDPSLGLDRGCGSHDGPALLREGRAQTLMGHQEKTLWRVTMMQ